MYCSKLPKKWSNYDGIKCEDCIVNEYKIPDYGDYEPERIEAMEDLHQNFDNIITKIGNYF